MFSVIWAEGIVSSDSNRLDTLVVLQVEPDLLSTMLMWSVKVSTFILDFYPPVVHTPEPMAGAVPGKQACAWD